MNQPLLSKFFSLALFLISLSFTPLAHAKRIQILHVNDLHGFVENTGKDKTRGGYGALKALIDTYRERGEEEGVKTLVLNAGDFMEGHISYTAKHGFFNFKAMDFFGFDAVVLGNHDWFMGAQKLDDLIGHSRPEFPIVGANFSAPIIYPDLKSAVKPYVMKKMAGLNVAILGLTTNEPFYKWLVPDVDITDATSAAQYFIPHLKEKEHADVVIALTHLGFKKDLSLARRTYGIDAIVGGHSHTAFSEILWGQNSQGKKVPIVQAGKHGTFLGRLILDISADKKVTVNSYELIPVAHAVASDALERYLKDIDDEIKLIYGESWLQQKVGASQVELLNSAERSTRWGRFISDATREAVGADVGIHSSEFAGQEFSSGDLTHKDIFNAYPRVFSFDDHRLGWRVWSAEMYGVVLKWAVRMALMTGNSLEISGMTFDIEKKVGGIWWAKNFRVQGEELKAWKTYRLALPEGLLTGGLALTRLAKLIFQNPNPYELSVQEAIALKLQKNPVITDDQLREKSLTVSPQRMMIPAQAYREEE